MTHMARREVYTITTNADPRAIHAAVLEIPVGALLVNVDFDPDVPRAAYGAPLLSAPIRMIFEREMSE